MEVTWGENPWLIEQYPRDTGGHICKQMYSSMSKNVTNVKDSFP